MARCGWRTQRALRGSTGLIVRFVERDRPQAAPGVLSQCCAVGWFGIGARWKGDAKLPIELHSLKIKRGFNKVSVDLGCSYGATVKEKRYDDCEHDRPP